MVLIIFLIHYTNLLISSSAEHVKC